MKMLKLCVCLVFVTTSAWACSEDGGSGSIPTCSDTFSACGGDPVGVWSYNRACATFSDPDCPGATGSILADRTTGTISFNADNSYVTAFNTDLDIQSTIPKSCLGGVDCQAAGAFIGGSCTESGDNCVCALTSTDSDTDSGTWAVSGNTLTLTDNSSADTVFEFCVSGNVMQANNIDDGSRLIVTR